MVLSLVSANIIPSLFVLLSGLIIVFFVRDSNVGLI